MSKQNLDFYKNTNLLSSFHGISNIDLFHQAPSDWVVVITDVIGSTKAIASGRHKEVNIAGVATIIALRNQFQKFEFPFVFGGDGATFLLPQNLLEEAKDVLAETRQNCKTLFDLNLRVGMVSVAELYAAGYEVLVAKHEVSQIYHQAVLTGAGIDYAEKLIKDEKLSQNYLLPDDFASRSQASFIGIFCPFQDISCAKDETISLIVKIIPDESDPQQAVLSQLMAKMDALLGQVHQYHPLADQVQIQWASALQTQQLVTLAAKSTRGLKHGLLWLLHKFIHFLTRFTVKTTLIRDADFRKYDGSLKMVIQVTSQVRQELQALLEQCYQDGKICYGMHISDKALITCCMHFSSGKGPIHFVDGADGGYAFAARQLKQQIQAGNTV